VLDPVALAAPDQVHLLNPVAIHAAADQAAELALEERGHRLVGVEDQDPVSG